MFNNLAEFVRRLFGGGHTLELLLAVVAVAVVAVVWRARYLRAKPGGAPYSGWKFSELRRSEPALDSASTNGATPHYGEPEDEPPVNPPLPELRVAPTFVADPEPVYHHEAEVDAVPAAAAVTVHDAISYAANGTNGANAMGGGNGASGTNGVHGMGSANGTGASSNGTSGAAHGTTGTAHGLPHDPLPFESKHELFDGQANGYVRGVSGDGVPVDDTIVFPTGRGFGDFRLVELPPPRTPSFELPETTAISSMLAGGLDDIAGGGDQLADAVRKRPIQYLLGALAAGFAAGVFVPALAGQNRIEKLLQRLVEGQDEIRRSRLP
jgi:hypothetical protein